MRVLIVATALIAAALVALPAEAANKKRKKAAVAKPPVSHQSGYQNLKRVPPHLQHPHGVYTADGELMGMDPDLNIRMMLRKDMRPWDNNS